MEKELVGVKYEVNENVTVGEWIEMSKFQNIMKKGDLSFEEYVIKCFSIYCKKIDGKEVTREEVSNFIMSKTGKDGVRTLEEIGLLVVGIYKEMLMDEKKKKI